MRLPLPSPPSCIAAAPAVLALLFAAWGEAKPLAQWQWLDIAGEGGTALMAGLWALLIVRSRPGGRVTAWLAGGLAAVMLGAWADCLDEFFVLQGPLQAAGWIESVLAPLGMLAVTAGLYGWRAEQAALSDHLSKRERLFRDHRAFDRVTQLPDAGYLRRQIALEQARRPEACCALVLLDIDACHRVERSHGPDEARRVLQAVSHQLLLNLRHRDLLCRYAGDRFVVLMPETPLAEARRRAGHLCRMVEAMSFHARGGDACLPLQARVACAAADADPQALLTALNRAVEADAPIAPAQAHTAGPLHAA